LPIVVYNAKRRTVEVPVRLGTAPKLATREYLAKKGGIPGSGVEPPACRPPSTPAWSVSNATAP